MQISYVVIGDSDLVIFFDVVEVDGIFRVGIFVGGLVDGSTGQIIGLFYFQIIGVVSIYDFISIYRVRIYREGGF